MILDNNNKEINIFDGLLTKDGQAYKMYMAKSLQGEVIDFSNNDEVYSMYPQSNSLVGSIEQLSKETIGSKTPIQISGSKTYSGDISWGGFTSSLPYILSLLMEPRNSNTEDTKATCLLYGQNHTITYSEVKSNTDNKEKFELKAFGWKLEENYALPNEISLYCSDVSYNDNIALLVLNNDKNKTFIEKKEGKNLFIKNNKDIVSETFTLTNYYKNNSQDIISVSLENKEVNAFEKSIPLDTFVISEQNTLSRKNGKLERDDSITINKIVSYGNYLTIEYTGVLVIGAYKSSDNKLLAYVEDGLIHLYLLEKEETILKNTSIEISGKYLIISKDLQLSSRVVNNILFKSLQVTQIEEATNSIIISKDEESYVYTYDSNSKYKDFDLFINSIPNMTLFSLFDPKDSLLTLNLFDYLVDDKYLLNGTILLDLFTLDKSLETENGKIVSLYEPTTQDAILSNILLYDTAAKENESKGFQYTDVELKNINFNFANKAFTELTTTCNANKSVKVEIESEKDIKVKKVEDRDSILVQTSEYPTIVYINGVEAKYFKDATFSLEWTKEDTYNVEAEKFIRDNYKYNWTFGGNMVLNELSRKLMDQMNNSEKVSIVIETKRKINGKVYKFFIVSLQITGIIQEPSIQAGELSLSLSGAVGSDYNVTDSRLSNFIIAIHDNDMVNN